MYPEAKDCLGWFKLHDDMLKQMTPKRHDDSNGDVCHITMKDWDDGTGPHLDAFPMEGDLWEHSLTTFPADLPPSPFNHTLMERLMQPAIWQILFASMICCLMRKMLLST